MADNITDIASGLKLGLFLFPGDYPERIHRDKYLKAYECWKEVWLDTYKNEIGIQSLMTSDDFTRQHIICSLFANDECVGVAFIRKANFQITNIFDDSFFRSWPDDVINRVGEISTSVALASYFTVGQSFRRNAFGFPWKLLLLHFFHETFLTTSCKVMITAARKAKSNEKLCYSTGAKPLLESCSYEVKGKLLTQGVDFLFWENSRTYSLPEDLATLAHTVWMNRYDLLTNQIEKEFPYAV